MYEAGEFNSYAVKVEVFDDQDKKAVLNVDGVTAMIYLKAEKVLAIGSKEELQEHLFKRIQLEELSGSLEEDLDDYSLQNVLNYLKDCKDDSPVISTLRVIERNAQKFEKDLSELNGLKLIKVHQYHRSSGEMGDFEDYLNIPYGEDADTMRTYLKENLHDSDIDQIMECFEDGEFYVNSFAGEELSCFDLEKQSVEESKSISEIESGL